MYKLAKAVAISPQTTMVEKQQRDQPSSHHESVKTLQRQIAEHEDRHRILENQLNESKKVLTNLRKQIEQAQRKDPTCSNELLENCLADVRNFR